ncbi:AAA family ATPase [Frankia sp. Cas3]|uniref:AAA family ATPase n=1 Tax=Frankia sp. Cas3 TaxID=3073926 RepID=UPI002AD3D06D|nr:AAA family ATPase [Frankia sp. Cas3]
MTAIAPARPLPFVRRVMIRDYRSVADCDVSLGPLTVLVGFNASGKSNFLDALRFVTDALEVSPAHAVSERGGLDALLRRRPDGGADSFGIRLDVALAAERDGGAAVAATYGVEIGRDPDGDLPLLVIREECRIELPGGPVVLSATAGRRRTSRLYLPVEAIQDDRYAAVDTALRAMRFYELDSAVLRALDEETTRRSELGSAGEHLGHVLGALQRDDRVGKERLDAYLSALVPNAVGVDERLEGRYSTVEARFRVGVADGIEVFAREALSEGTLRAAGVLAALFQPPAFDGRISLIGIEEPETALHPATVGALYEALDDAALRTQVIVTSQSSDLLDSEYVRLGHIRAVANLDGVTHVGEVDAASHAIVAKKIMTVGELHRSGRMMPVQADRPAGRRADVRRERG